MFPQTETSSLPYSDAFFDDHEKGALESARLVAPMVLRFIRPASVLDIGCARGAWLRAFRELGVKEIRGLDGDYVDRSRLLVAPECFTSTDLSRPFEIPGRYDLAVCLEVAEHLPEKMAPFLVDKLVEAAPAVLFSAAIPGQGGTHHINEKMPAYWRDLFRSRGYVLLDAIRPSILTDSRIETWYRQNAVLYVSEEFLLRSPALEPYRLPDDGPGIEWVQAYILDSRQCGSVRSLCRQLSRAIECAIRWRLQAVIARLSGGPSVQ